MSQASTLRWQSRNRDLLAKYRAILKQKGYVTYRCASCGLVFEHGKYARQHGKILGHKIVLE